MPSRSPLAQYILTQILMLGETPEQFASRVGINPSGFHKFVRGEYQEVRQSTLAKIARGLNRTPADILAAASAVPVSQTEAELQTLGEMFKSIVRDIPYPFWKTIIETVTSTANVLTASTRGNMENTVVTSTSGTVVTDQPGADNTGKSAAGPDLIPLYVRRPSFGHEAVMGFTHVTAGVSA